MPTNSIEQLKKHGFTAIEPNGFAAVADWMAEKMRNAPDFVCEGHGEEINSLGKCAACGGDVPARKRIQAAYDVIFSVVGEEEGYRIIADNIEPSTRYDITADHAELIAWAVCRRVVMNETESPLWMVDAQAADADAADLLDTQRSATW